MAIITRLTRLFQADFNALLDRMEEPEIMLRQSIRDMELHLDQGNREIRSLSLDLERCQREQQSLGDQRQELARQLDLCLAADKLDLARSLVRRKLETGLRIEHARAQEKTLQESVNRKKLQRDKRQSRLEHLRQKAEVLLPATAARATESEAVTITDEQVEIALLQEQARRAEQ